MSIFSAVEEIGLNYTLQSDHQLDNYSIFESSPLHQSNVFPHLVKRYYTSMPMESDVERI